MRWIDMHCDTLSRLIQGEEGTLLQNKMCVDTKRLKKAGASAQFFACFVNAKAERKETDICEKGGGEVWDRAYREVEKMICMAHEQEGKHLSFIQSEDWLDQTEREGKTAGILTVEEGGILNGQTERLEELFQKGVRLITLTWNYENCLGSPNSRTPAVMERGLKKFGLETVERMNELGMLIDVSHLSDGGFWDCIRKSRTPVVASHSNARALCAHPRNLSDDMLRALGNKGGVAGLNFYSPFLRVSQHGDAPKAELDDLVRHAVWIVDRAGEDAAALGTDFDGFEQEALPRGICGVQDIGKLWEAFRRGGLTPRQIEKIAWRNVRRVLREVCR